MRHLEQTTIEPRLAYLEAEHRAFAVCRGAEVFREDTIEASDGMPLTVLQAGDPRRPAVLLINALGVSCLFLAEIARRLAPDYHVLTWESRGLPNEVPLADRADLSVERHCLDAAEVLTAKGAEAGAVVAYCSGANVAVYALAKGVIRAERLCIISPSMQVDAAGPQTDYQRTMLPLWEKIDRSGPAHAALVRALLKEGARSGHGSIDDELRVLNDLPFRTNESTYRYARLQAECLRHDWPGLLRQVQASTLVFHCDQDDMIHSETSRAVARHVAGAAFRTIPAGHFAVYTSRELHDEVAAFLGDPVTGARPTEPARPEAGS